jgi:hypothetical protein
MAHFGNGDDGCGGRSAGSPMHGLRELSTVAWCAGDHPRADGDDDGIPCENLCSTRAEVVAIMAEIGCSR